jgi:hypothetical protein
MTAAANGRVTLDCRIFHRAGLDGAHHVEEDVQFLIDPHPPRDVPDGEVVLLLTQDERERLPDTYAHALDGMAVNLNDPTHPQVEAVHR